MHFLLFLKKVVIHLDAKHDGARDSGNHVGDEQGPVLEQQALDGKEDATQAHHQEGGKGNTIGIMGADGVDSLRHVTQNQAN